jgi:hypothetical protein
MQSCTSTLRKPTALRTEAASSVESIPCSLNKVLAAVLAGSGFPLGDGDIVGNAAEQPQDAIFVYHRLTVPAEDTGGELPVRAGDAR